MTLMFCDFGPSPRICRFFCKGRVVEWDQRGFQEWVKRVRGDRKVEEAEGVRAVIILDVWKVSAFLDESNVLGSVYERRFSNDWLR